MSYRQRLLDRIHIDARREEKRLAAELGPIAHRLNDPLLENANHLIDRVNAGEELSDWEAGHLVDLHREAQVLTAHA